MTPDELRERIARGEDPHTDFKRTVDRNADLARDLVCFANSDGGQLIIGVADDRTVVGVQDVDALMLRVDDVAFNLCSPPVTAVPETVPFDGHDVVVLNVAKGDQRPYSTRDGRYYIRAGARCRQASREELLRLFQAAQSLFYDEQPLPRLSIKDLDLLDVARYLASTQQQDLDDDLPRLLRAWRLYDGAHPTVGGVVLFGRAAQAVLESARMVVGAVAGADIGTDFIDRKDLVGGLFDLVAQAEAWGRLASSCSPTGSRCDPPADRRTASTSTPCGRASTSPATRTSTLGSPMRSSPLGRARGSAGSRDCCARTEMVNSVSGSAKPRSP